MQSRVSLFDEPRTAPDLGDNLAWVNLFVAVVSAMAVFASTLGIAGCSERCDYPVLEVVTRGFWLTDLLVFLLTTGTYFVVESRIRRAWVIPAAGIAVTLIAFAITCLVVTKAMSVG
ncbi:hypothetical protein [Microbacterium sp. SD291]|uniref:hypothetical protein n=1 Tax=Microbacterium sp. SD291 TaxID=2782007 RepID=UPI001A9780AB|nr:hypothetical protein [Microbacterium sp. SD291]MBO0981648.1 hypothetical protein [Microbacterium sp. SD291]